MSWGGALGGMGRGLSSIANKYIDEELAQERAKMLADLQLKSAKDLDEYQLSEPRQAKLRDNATAASLAQKAAERQAATEGVNDTAYQGALDTQSANDTRRRVTSENALVEGTTPTKITAANQIEDGTRGSRMKTVQEETNIRTNGQIRAHNSTKQPDPSAKLRPEDKAMLDWLSKEQERVVTEVVKAKAADGGWDTKRNPGQAELEKRLNTLNLQRAAILERYREGGTDGGNDPLGVRGKPGAADSKPDAAPAPGAAPTPKKAEPAPAKTYEQLSAESMAKADDRLLRRLASSKGHKDQKAAAEELARRQKQWDEEAAEQQTTGFGFN
jgi:hypothetical protein